MSANALISQLSEYISGLESEVADLRDKANTTGIKRANRKKLDRFAAADIRQMYRTGVSQRALSDIYDVNPATISRIVRGIYHKQAV